MPFPSTSQSRMSPLRWGWTLPEPGSCRLSRQATDWPQIVAVNATSAMNLPDWISVTMPLPSRALRPEPAGTKPHDCQSALPSGTGFPLLSCLPRNPQDRAVRWCRASAFSCGPSRAFPARRGPRTRARRRAAPYSAGAPALLAIARLRFFANLFLRRFTRAFWYAAISGADRK